MIHGLLKVLTFIEIFTFIKWARQNRKQNIQRTNDEDNTELSKVPQNTRASKE